MLSVLNPQMAGNPQPPKDEWWKIGDFRPRKLLAVLVLFLTLTAATYAQPVEPKPKSPPIKAPSKFKSVAPPQVKAGEHIVIDASSAAGDVEFKYDKIAFPKERATLMGKTLVLSTSVNGTYQIFVVSYADGKTEDIAVKVTGGIPIPPGPPDPPVPTDPLEALTAAVKALTLKIDLGFAQQSAENAAMKARLLALEQIKPIPPPDPPTPPAPIPLAGYRVLIVYDPNTLTDAQQGIVFGKAVRDYLQAKCVVGNDGKTKDFWIIQSGLDVSAAPKWIGDVIQRHPGQRTFMVVSDGKTGYDGAIPANAEEAMNILKKIGGP